MEIEELKDLIKKITKKKGIKIEGKIAVNKTGLLSLVGEGGSHIDFDTDKGRFVLSAPKGREARCLLIVCNNIL